MFLNRWLSKWRRKRKDECTECGIPLHIQTMSELSGEDEGIKVTFHNLQSKTCGKRGHPKRYVDLDFGMHLTEGIFFEKHTPLTKDNFLKRTRCYKCATKLAQRPSIEKELYFAVPLEYMPGLKVAIKAPVVKCNNCGEEQIKANEKISNHISEAILDAFKKANLSH